MPTAARGTSVAGAVTRADELLARTVDDPAWKAEAEQLAGSSLQHVIAPGADQSVQVVARTSLRALEELRVGRNALARSAGTGNGAHDAATLTRAATEFASATDAAAQLTAHLEAVLPQVRELLHLEQVSDALGSAHETVEIARRLRIPVDDAAARAGLLDELAAASASADTALRAAYRAHPLQDDEAWTQTARRLGTTSYQTSSGSWRTTTPEDVDGVRVPTSSHHNVRAHLEHQLTYHAPDTPTMMSAALPEGVDGIYAPLRRAADERAAASADLAGAILAYVRALDLPRLRAGERADHTSVVRAAQRADDASRTEQRIAADLTGAWGQRVRNILPHAEGLRRALVGVGEAGSSTTFAASAHVAAVDASVLAQRLATLAQRYAPVLERPGGGSTQGTHVRRYAETIARADRLLDRTAAGEVAVARRGASEAARRRLGGQDALSRLDSVASSATSRADRSRAAGRREAVDRATQEARIAAGEFGAEARRFVGALPASTADESLPDVQALDAAEQRLHSALNRLETAQLGRAPQPAVHRPIDYRRGGPM